MHLRIIRTIAWLHEHVPVSSMIGDIVSQTRGDWLVILLYSPVGLRVTCGRGQCFISKYLHMVSKNLLANCGRLSVSTWFVMQMGTIRWSKKMFTTCVAIFLAVGITRVDLEYLSVITTTYCFLCVVLEKGSRISRATNSRGLHEEIIGAVVYVCINFRS